MVSNRDDKKLERTNTGVYIHDRTHFIIPTEIDEYADEGYDHAVVCHGLRNKWRYHLIDNTLAGVTILDHPTVEVLNVGIDGEVVVGTEESTQRLEHVDQSDRGPNHSLILRCVRQIGNHAYVAGMARMVYKRLRDGEWRPWDNGMYVPREEFKYVVGLNDIHGVDENSIYAVGFMGEIWHYDGQRWIEQHTPTNLTLTGVYCVSMDEVYASGMVGMLLRGRNGVWEVIEQECTKQDFWGITYFQEKIFLAGTGGVYVLTPVGLQPVDMQLGRRVSTGYLDAADGILLSVGEKDIVYTVNGVDWHEIEGP